MHRDWEEIANFYSSLKVENAEFSESLFALYKLCMWISDSEADELLFGTTSLTILMIYQKPLEYEDRLRSQYLVIEPIENGCVEFRFMDTCKPENQWVRIASEDDIVDRMRGFIRQVGWAYHSVL